MSYMRLPHYSPKINHVNTTSRSPVSELRSTFTSSDPQAEMAMAQLSLGPSYQSPMDDEPPHFRPTRIHSDFTESTIWFGKLDPNPIFHQHQHQHQDHNQHVEAESQSSSSSSSLYSMEVDQQIQTVDTQVATQEFPASLLNAPRLESVEWFEDLLPIPESPVDPFFSSPAPEPALAPEPAPAPASASIAPPVAASAPNQGPIHTTNTPSRRSTRLVTPPQHLADYVDVATTSNSATVGQPITIRIPGGQPAATSATIAQRARRRR